MLHTKIVLNSSNSHWGWCFQNPRECWVMISFVDLFWVCWRWRWRSLYTLVSIRSFCEIIHLGGLWDKTFECYSLDIVLLIQCIINFQTQYTIVILFIPEIWWCLDFLLSEEYKSMKQKMILVDARPPLHSSHDRLHLHCDLPKICFALFLLRYFRQFYRVKCTINYLSFSKKRL